MENEQWNQSKSSASDVATNGSGEPKNFHSDVGSASPPTGTGPTRKCLTQERVRELFDYREDGCFVRRVGRGNQVKAGTVAGAGAVRADGYTEIRVGSRSYLTHRLVWLWHNGYLPEQDIDHIDRDKLNNRIKNLREVSRACNNRNTPNHVHNTSGVKGVSWHARDSTWRARISVNGKNLFLAYSFDFTEAVAHRLAAEQCHDWELSDGCSPAFRYMEEYLNEKT